MQIQTDGCLVYSKMSLKFQYLNFSNAVNKKSSRASLGSLSLRSSTGIFRRPYKEITRLQTYTGEHNGLGQRPHKRCTNALFYGVYQLKGAFWLVKVQVSSLDDISVCLINT